MDLNRVAVIVPAAGSGSRIGGIPKQFRLLGDAPLLVQTLRVFTQVGEVASIVVAVPEVDVQDVEALLRQYELAATVVAGGTTRQESVGKGLEAVTGSAEIVLVHDAVRPFVSVEQVREVIAAIREQGDAAVDVPVADTLRRGADGRFGGTVDREGLYRMLTPQGARTEALRDAHKKAVEEGFTATDEVQLLQRAGLAVHRVEGDERNIKITRPSDWAIAEALWPGWVAGEGARQAKD